MQFKTCQTTAIYPNRLQDKERLEAEKQLNEFGDQDTSFYTANGTLSQLVMKGLFTGTMDLILSLTIVIFNLR